MIKRCVPLEPAAEEVCNQSSVPPLIFQMPLDQTNACRTAMDASTAWVNRLDEKVYNFPIN